MEANPNVYILIFAGIWEILKLVGMLALSKVSIDYLRR